MANPLEEWLERVLHVRVTDFLGTAAPGQPAEAGGVAPPGSADLGALSEHYESGGHGPGAVGWDSTGGWSYGTYQIATQTGTMRQFLDYVQTADPATYKALAAAGGDKGATDHTDAFAKAWAAAAKAPGFTGLEHGFIGQTHYQPQADTLKADGLDVGSRAKAVRDVTWSVAVEHGPGATVIVNALRERIAAEAAKDKAAGKTRTRQQIIDGISDQQLIEAIYDERGATVEKGGKSVLKYFSHSSADVQKALTARFASERAAAERELATEQAVKP